MRGQDYQLGYAADAAGVAEHPERGHREGRKDAVVTRREFLELAIATTVVAGVGHSSWAVETKGGMPYRTLGRTGEKVSLVGLGGYHIGKQADEQESLRIIRTAIDNGVNFMDNCWDYNDGASESRMGKALRDGYRRQVFLMTKIDGRNKNTAAKQIDESLRRLQTDRIDLLQFHEVIRPSDPDRIFAPQMSDQCYGSMRRSRYQNVYCIAV